MRSWRELAETDVDAVMQLFERAIDALDSGEPDCALIHATHAAQLLAEYRLVCR
jgi:hypothetical protein